jgi:polyhydroxybutyrate depolymerase
MSDAERRRSSNRRPGLTILTVVIALTLGAASCSGGFEPTVLPATPSIASPPGATATLGAPVETPSVTAAPKRQEAIAVGGDERMVDLFLAPLDPGEHRPLIVLLHPNGGSPHTLEKDSKIGVLAARERVIVALPPAASDHRWQAMSDGDSISDSPDEAYVVGLIDHLLETLPIDAGRVYLAGFSMGAVMSERIACRFPETVAAIAMDAGAPWADQCDPARPVSVLVMHGTEDSTLRIAGAVKVVARWRSINGCEGDPETSRLGERAESQLNAGCRDGTAVQFVRYVGSGHVWFRNPDATELLWEFFEAHPRR